MALTFKYYDIKKQYKKTLMEYIDTSLSPNFQLSRAAAKLSFVFRIAKHFRNENLWIHYYSLLLMNKNYSIYHVYVFTLQVFTPRGRKHLQVTTDQ